MLTILNDDTQLALQVCVGWGGPEYGIKEEDVVTALFLTAAASFGVMLRIARQPLELGRPRDDAEEFLPTVSDHEGKSSRHVRGWSGGSKRGKGAHHQV